ncbi:unnamed protein product, partial [Mycena citricolor]
MDGPEKHRVEPIPIRKTVFWIFADESSGGGGESSLQ